MSTDRYPPDQQFGDAAADDQETVDRLESEGGPQAVEQADERDEKPRAANKAEPS